MSSLWYLNNVAILLLSYFLKSIKGRWEKYTITWFLKPYYRFLPLNSGFYYMDLLTTCKQLK